MQKKETEYLVERAKKSDADAFTKLMQLYMKDMYKVSLAILKNDADIADAIQDTILSCWEKLFSLKQNQYFKTWMIRILINKCYEIQRKNKVYTSLGEFEEVSYEDSYNIEFKEAKKYILNYITRSKRYDSIVNYQMFIDEKKKNK